MRIRLTIFYSIVILSVCFQASTAGSGLKITYSCLQADSLFVKNTLSVTDTLRNDSLAVIDSLQYTVRDTLIPLNQRKLLSPFSGGEVYSKNIINILDYRSFHDLFRIMPFGFVRDFGSFGQPHELSMFGLGYGSADFIVDGIPLNKRSGNYYDLNHIQTEQIDSLEIIPLSRGFLYNTFSNPVSVNIITLDRQEKHPYSRLRIHQAPDNEGLVDGLFNAQVFDRVNFSFNVTNTSVDSRYSNSEAGGWLASARIKYMPLNSVNLIADYRYARTLTGLNGGVDLDQLFENYSGEEVTDNFYNSLRAPVYYGTDQNGYLRYLKSKEHNFSLKLLSKFIPNIFSDITFYYRFSLDEFRQNEFMEDSGLPYFKNDGKEKTLGVAVKEYLTNNFFDLQLFANYESQNIEDDYLNINSGESIFSAGGYIKFPIAGDIFVPGAYVKYLKNDAKSFAGFGGEIFFRPICDLEIFAGYSQNQKPYSVKEKIISLQTGTLTGDQKIDIIEARAKYKWYFGNISAGFIKYSNGNYPFPVINYYTDSLLINEIGFFKSSPLKYSAFNINLDLSIWRIKVENKFSYYLNKNSESEYFAPRYFYAGGIYYVDTLFSTNLKLKAGLNFYSTGQQRFGIYDFQLMRQVYLFNDNGNYIPIKDETISSTYQLDLFLAGKIKNLAIIYFVFENLTGYNYYVIPYYPKQGRSLRFGVAWEFLD